MEWRSSKRNGGRGRGRNGYNHNNSYYRDYQPNNNQRNYHNQYYNHYRDASPDSGDQRCSTSPTVFFNQSCQTDDLTNAVVAQISQVSATQQMILLETVFPHLKLETLNFAKELAENLSKRDFIGDLPPEIVARIFNYLDISDHGRIARVSRKWRGVVSPVWKTACVRYGLTITTDDEQYWTNRVKRTSWRRRMWLNNPLDCMVVSCNDPVPSDQTTLLYIGDMDNRNGYLAVATKPGDIVFYSEVEHGGTTYYLKTGIDLKPTCVRSFGPTSIMLGFENGLVQHWDWRLQTLSLELQVISAITAVDYSPWADMVAIGAEDGSVSLWRATTAEFLGNFVDSKATKVVKLRFVARDTITQRNLQPPQLTTRLFLAVLHETQAFSFMYGKKRRAFCDLNILEIEPWSGAIWGEVYSRSTMLGQLAVKNSLKVDVNEGIFTYLTVDYQIINGMENFDSKYVYIHEIDPASGFEKIGTLLYDPPCPTPSSPCIQQEYNNDQTLGIREWELLGIGRSYAALSVAEMIGDGVVNSGRLALVVYRRPSGSGTDKALWSQMLTHPLLDPDWFMFTSMVLGKRSWLDGFDGENDSGLLMAACYHDFNTGQYAMQSHFWSEPENL